MVEFILAVRDVMKREWRRISSRKNLYLLMIMAPILLFFGIAAIYQHKVVSGLPVAVLDADHSELSRTITAAVRSNRTFELKAEVQTLQEIEEGLRSGRFEAAFYMPQGMEREIKRGTPAELIIYRNHFNLLTGNMILKDGATIGRTMSVGILLKKLASRGLGPEQALALANPIRVDSRPLFNPAYNYANYLVPGLLPAMMQMFIMLVAVLLLSAEYTEQSLSDLYSAARGSSWAVLLGKSAPHLLVHAATALGLIGVVFPLFGIPIAGSVTLLFGLLMLFMAASLTLGLLISCLVPNQMLATEIAVFINTPAFMFSGYTFPLWGMPHLHQLFSQIMPFTHFLSAFIKVYQMGTPWRYIKNEIMVLSLFVVIALALSWLALAWRSRRLLSPIAAQAGELEGGSVL